jgi:hypothetical protein
MRSVSSFLVAFSLAVWFGLGLLVPTTQADLAPFYKFDHDNDSKTRNQQQQIDSDGTQRRSLSTAEKVERMQLQSNNPRPSAQRQSRQQHSRFSRSLSFAAIRSRNGGEDYAEYVNEHTPTKEPTKKEDEYKKEEEEEMETKAPDYHEGDDDDDDDGGGDYEYYYSGSGSVDVVGDDDDGKGKGKGKGSSSKSCKSSKSSKSCKYDKSHSSDEGSTDKPEETPKPTTPPPAKYPTEAPAEHPTSPKEYIRFVMVREEAGTPVPGYFGIGDSLALNGQIYYWEGTGDKYVSEVPSGSFVALCTGVTTNDDLLCTYEIILRVAKAGDTSSGVGVLVATGPNYYEENDMIVTGTEFDFAKYNGGTLVTEEDPVQPYLYATLYLI